MGNKFEKQAGGAQNTAQTAQVQAATQAAQSTRRPSDIDGGNKPRQTLRNVGSINSVLRRSMARYPTSAAVANAISAITDDVIGKIPELRELYENRNLGILPLDGVNRGLEVSSILVVRQEGDVAVAMNLVLSSTAEDLGDLFIDQRDREDRSAGPISIARVPSDIYAESKEYRNAIIDVVKEAYPACSIELAGQMVIQETIDVTNPVQVRPAIYRALTECESILVDLGYMESGRYNLSDYDESVKFSVRASFAGKQDVDDLGNYSRRDITLTTISRQPEYRDGNRERIKTSTESVVQGYMDATFRGQDTEKSRDNYWNVDNTATFNPVFVITNLDTASDAVEFAQLIFGLTASNLLAESNRWIAAFNPQFSLANPNRFVGALGADVPLEGTQIDRQGKDEVIGKLRYDDSFDYVDFARQAFYLDSLMIALDVEEAGQNSPVQSIFIDMAAGGQEGRDATEAFVAAADEAFDGRFSSAWEDAGCPDLVRDIGTRIPLGYYTNEKGENVDVRYIDLIHMYNANDDALISEKFDRALYDSDLDDRRRLSDLLGILRETNSTFKLTGYARRIFLTNEFFEVVAAALNDARITLEYEGSFDVSSRKRTTRHLSGLGTQGSGLFRNRARGGRATSGRSGAGWGSSAQRFRR